VCLGCGRTAEEIEGVPAAPPLPAAPQPALLPPNVVALVGEGTE